MLQEAEMSLADFHVQLQEHRYQIKHLWDSTSTIYEQFAQEEIIYPEHCEEVSSAIRKMRVSVRGFYQLLGKSSQLPLAIVPYSFSPAIKLRQIDELSDELMVLVLLFRKICCSTSQDIMVHHQEILSKLYTLARGYEDVLHDIDRLLLQVFAQKKAERSTIIGYGR
jgi:hypothetical protein